MKIYFFANLSAKSQKQSDQVVDILHQAGVLVLSNLEQENIFEFSQYDKDRMNESGGLLLERVDALIIDGQTSAEESGYLIALALAHKKPILYLIPKGKFIDKHLSELAKNREIAKILLVEFYNESNLKKKLLDFLLVAETKEGRQRPNIKFTLRITPRIERYLHWKTHNTKLSKADFLREMIENIIDQDDKYRQYQSKKGD